MKDKYRCVSCDFYDQLEQYATRNTKLFLSYLASDATEQLQAVIRIATLETKNKEEYMITKSGLRLRLDRIISLTPAVE